MIFVRTMILMEFEKKNVSFVLPHFKKQEFSDVLWFSKVRSKQQKIFVRTFILIIRSYITTILSKKSWAPTDQIVVA